jgi:hypothetical protein
MSMMVRTPRPSPPTRYPTAFRYSISPDAFAAIITNRSTRQHTSSNTNTINKPLRLSSVREAGVVVTVGLTSVATLVFEAHDLEALVPRPVGEPPRHKEAGQAPLRAHEPEQSKSPTYDTIQYMNRINT